MARENSVGPQGPEMDRYSPNADQPPADAPAEKKEEAKVVSPIALDKNSQMMVAKDSNELMRQIKILMQGKSFPKTFDTPVKCITAWNLAASMGSISPQRAIARMMFINERIELWGELPKALAEGTKELQDFELFLVNKEFVKICVENKNLSDQPYAGVCRIQRKDRTKNEYHFTMDDAEKAGLLSKKGPWQEYIKDMLLWRAEARAIKHDFGDATMGCEISEHRDPFDPRIKDVTPISRAEELNSVFSKEVQNAE